MSKIDPSVILKRVIWMQRVQDLVRTGHRYHVSGQCDLERLPDLYDKFQRLYDIDATTMQASRMRRAGRCSARFLILLLPTGRAHWILLRTEGALSPAAKDVRETWRDALDERVNLDHFELVRMTKPGQKTTSWTWRYEKQRYDDLRALIIENIAKKRDADLERLTQIIWASPGFHGIRAQIKKLPDLIKSEWQRHKRTADKSPELPKHLGYVRKLSDKSKKVSFLLKEKCFDNAAR